MSRRIVWSEGIKKILVVLIVPIVLISCASNKNPKIKDNVSEPQNSYDYLEKLNRKTNTMNMTLDKYIIRPTTVGYINYIPLPVRIVVNNFFNNLRDVVTLGNDILQLQGLNVMQNLMRIGINTTFGLAGTIDIATSLGLPMHKNSFGQTFKFYGWRHSTYFVIPFLGPSTIRDTLGMIPDVVFNPTWYIITDNYVSVGLYVVSALDTRSKYLGADQLFATSIDPYTSMRDAYLQSINEFHSNDYNNTTTESKESGENNSDIDTLINEENNTPSSGNTVPSK